MVTFFRTEAKVWCYIRNVFIKYESVINHSCNFAGKYRDWFSLQCILDVLD